MRPNSELRGLIADALQSTSDPHETGRLLVARAIALQGCGDASESAEAARASVAYLRQAGDLASAAYASAMAAVFLDQSGRTRSAMEHAVDSLILLGDLEVVDVDAVRASLAVSGFFMRLSAFDLAVSLARRAFDGARLLEGISMDSIAYSFGYVAAEAGHVTNDDNERRQHLNEAKDAADWLMGCGANNVSTVMLAGGLFAEIDLANGALPDRKGLADAASLYDESAPDLVAWHLLVRGSAAFLDGDPAAAIKHFDVAIPGLEASADNHCLVRAFDQRASARADLGDFAGAYADASHLAHLIRAWHVAQIGELADQVAHRADLQRSNNAWQHAAEQLADDIDSDATTGVGSRRWLDRHLDALELDRGTAWALMFDLDRFKNINDTFGHHIGDKVLARFGTLLSSTAGPSTAIARFGGEEFVVIICSEPDDGQTGAIFAEQVRLSTAAHDWGSIAPGLDLTVSCGVSAGRRADIKHLLMTADEALLSAKHLGRNRVSLAPGTLEHDAAALSPRRLT